MRISVALCTFNGERFLPDQLASIAGQGRPPDEVVACDDGSTDATMSILGSFAESAPFPVRIHRNGRNLGSTANFEQAIGLCEGEILALADQDDRWLPAKLATIEEIFARSPGVGLVFSDADLIDEHDRPMGCSLWESVRLGAGRVRRMGGSPLVPKPRAGGPSSTHRVSGAPPEGFDKSDRRKTFAELLQRPCVTGATMAFRSIHRALLRPIPPEWVHDEWIALLIASASQIQPIREPLMQYRRHSRNQVGVSGATIAERTRKSLARPVSEFQARAEAFGQLRQHLADKLPEPSPFLAELDGKIRHVRTRADLPESRLFRLPTVLRELLTGRYARYSGTAISSIRDLVARR